MHSAVAVSRFANCSRFQTPPGPITSATQTSKRWRRATPAFSARFSLLLWPLLSPTSASAVPFPISCRKSSFGVSQIRLPRFTPLSRRSCSQNKVQHTIRPTFSELPDDRYSDVRCGLPRAPPHVGSPARWLLAPAARSGLPFSFTPVGGRRPCRKRNLPSRCLARN